MRQPNRRRAGLAAFRMGGVFPSSRSELALQRTKRHQNPAPPDWGASVVVGATAGVDCVVAPGALLVSTFWPLDPHAAAATQSVAAQAIGRMRRTTFLTGVTLTRLIWSS